MVHFVSAHKDGLYISISNDKAIGLSNSSDIAKFCVDNDIYDNFSDRVAAKLLEVTEHTQQPSDEVLDDVCSKISAASKHIDQILSSKSSGIAEQAQQQKAEIEHKQRYTDDLVL